MKLSELHTLIGAALAANGDTEHVALGIVMRGDEPRRVDVFGEIELLQDTANHPNGMTYLVAEYVVDPEVKKPSIRPTRKKAVTEDDEPHHPRISHPSPGVTRHRCV